MIIKIGKPDFYVVLKKRKRTVGQFLENRNVFSEKDLEDLIESIEVEHLVSDKFREEAKKYLENHLSKTEKFLQEPKRDILDSNNTANKKDVSFSKEGTEQQTKETAQRKQTKKTRSSRKDKKTNRIKKQTSTKNEEE